MHRLIQKLGLSNTEASIYLAALELGKSLPKHLAEKARIKRPTLYSSLPGLIEQGLLSETIVGKRRYIVAEDLESYIDNKQSDLKQLEEKLPEIQALLGSATVRPHILFYPGIEGLKKVYMDNLRAGKSILNFIGLENIDPEIEKYAASYYVPERIRRSIHIKVLLSGPQKYGSLFLKTDKKALREVRTVDIKQFPFPLDAYIYGKTISFIVYRKDSEPIGIIIRSQEIATSLRSLFKLAWQTGKLTKI